MGLYHSQEIRAIKKLKEDFDTEVGAVWRKSQRLRLFGRIGASHSCGVAAVFQSKASKA